MAKKNNIPLALPFDGPGRAQVVILGNGLERKDDGGPGSAPLRDAGKSWDELVRALTVEGHVPLEEGDLASVPFPLKYHLLSSRADAEYPLGAASRRQEQAELAKAVRNLGTVTNPALRRLPELGADHIFTTNYTYSLERAFYPRKNLLDAQTRSNLRFNYCPEVTGKGNQKRGGSYRLYSGCRAANRDGSPVDLWHIHGECAVAGSIILGHDGYGRLLSRIVPVCGDPLKYKTLKSGKPYAFTSWPELFLFGDVYVLGLGLGISEFDLWWLLRRKQREEKGTGRVYFYTNDEKDRDRDLMLTALGVNINPGGQARGVDHSDFYRRALDDISARIADNRRQRDAEQN